MNVVYNRLFSSNGTIKNVNLPNHVYEADRFPELRFIGCSFSEIKSTGALKLHSTSARTVKAAKDILLRECSGIENVESEEDVFIHDCSQGIKNIKAKTVYSTSG